MTAAQTDDNSMKGIIGDVVTVVVSVVRKVASYLPAFAWLGFFLLMARLHYFQGNWAYVAVTVLLGLVPLILQLIYTEDFIDR